jgi:hypothetical protein
MVQPLLSRLPNFLARLFRREMWNIGLVHQSLDHIVRFGIQEPIQWRHTNSQDYYADPFVIHQGSGDEFLLFAERMNFSSNKGEIVCALTCSENFQSAVFECAISSPYHLSYPQIISNQCNYHLLVESWEQGGTVEFVSKSPRGPWDSERVLLPFVNAIDTTVIWHDGLWYAFFSKKDDKPNQNLFIAFSHDLNGTWTMHPQNPVMCNLNGARSAGPIIRLHSGELIRPGQDCRTTYGGGISLFCITELSPTAYQETPLRTLAPERGRWSEGLHTICPVDANYCVVDGKRWQWHPLEPLRKLVGQLYILRRRFTNPRVG